MERASIIYGLTGQVLEFYPPEWAAGVPGAAATFRVWAAHQSDDDTPEFQGTATMDTVSLQITGASGYSQVSAAGGRKRLLMSSTTGLVVDRFYTVENGDSQRELVRTRLVKPNTYVDVEYDLQNDYPNAASSLLKGFRQAATVDGTFVVTESKLNYPEKPYRVQWTYTLGGIVRRHLSLFDLVRAPKKHGVTGYDFVGLWPTLFHQLDRDKRGQSGDYLVKEGWKRVQKDLMLDGVDPNSIHDTLLDELVIAAAVLTAAESGKAPPGRDLEVFVRERTAIYHRDKEKAISGNHLIVSQNTEGAITQDPKRPGWFAS